MSPSTRYSSNNNSGAAAVANSSSSSPKRNNRQMHHQPRSPSREEENSIRRGADIIRRQIQKQMLDMGDKLTRSSNSNSRAASPVNTTPSSGGQQQQREAPLPTTTSTTRSVRKESRPWKEGFSWTPPVRKEGANKTAATRTPTLKLDNNNRSKPDMSQDDALTDFSDPWKNQRDVGAAVQKQQQQPHRRVNSVEVDPPLHADWSEDEEDTDGVMMNLAQTYGLTRTASHPPNQELNVPAPTPKIDPPASSNRNTRNNVQMFTATTTTTTSTTPARPRVASAAFSSDEEEDDDDIVSMLDSQQDLHLLSMDKNCKSPVSLTSPLGACLVESVYTYQERNKAVVVPPLERQPPTDSSSSGSSSLSESRYPQLSRNGEYEEAEQGHMVRITPEKASSYRLPMYLEDKSPEKMNMNPLRLPQPSLIDYEDDDDDDEDYENFESPEKGRPVHVVPTQSPSTVSQLSTPEKSASSKNKPKSSALMQEYDALLRDPAYLHAQSAGFLWQSVVGQHVRFPSRWWNGARGPPIGDEDSPWMYFGRQTVQRNRVLNQLVKGRASAGRLLLHIIVQDLMTRTPVQDIAIGCFHPNAKGIRKGDRALKRFEDCRDVWMAVRKRSKDSVSATDSLLYSQSNWDGGHCMSRSPLGSGQRVTNTNVRSVFGDKAPLETIFLSEDELYERLASRILLPTLDGAVSPPMAILEEFVFA